MYGPAIVVAGPGSGKTGVLVNRLQYLVSKAGIDPSSILTITFTRAAGIEMKTRAQALLGDAAASITFGTFHFIFFHILRHTYRFTSENIITADTQLSILGDILTGKGQVLPDFRRAAFTLLSEISRVKCGRSTDKAVSSVLPDDLFSEVCDLYRKRMNDLRLIDFDDMVLRVCTLFCERPEVLKKWQDRFRFILVDECQDMDPAQYEAVRMLAGESKNLFLVGDDDQSIYSFRGADPTIMQKFIEDSPHCRVIRLGTNYRSEPEIVGAASKVIAENENRIEKVILAHKEGSGDEKNCVDIREFHDREKEMEALRDALKELKGHYNDAAILLRTNTLASFVAEKLNLYAIPCRCREKLTDPYDHFIAQDIFAYLRLASGDRRRGVFYRVMNRPYRCISRDAVSGASIDFKEMRNYHKQDLKTFSEINRLERDLKIISGMKPYAAVHYILNGMGYLKYLKNYAVKKGVDFAELKGTAEDIKARAKQFRSFIAWEEAAEEYRISLNEMKQRATEPDTEEAVTIMTLHGAKGLEFKEVFLPDVNEGILPSDKAVMKNEIEEERRLFYVGMTRAEKYLHIWHICDDHGKKMTASRFLKPFESE